MCLAVMAIVRLSYFFGRRQLTNLPMLQKQYEQCDFSAAKEAKDSSFLKSAEYYDADKVNMPLLSPNQPVVIQHPKTGKWDSAGIIVGIWPDKQSYTVNCEGRTFIRSRQMLRANKQIEVNVTASPEQSTSPSKCVNPKTLPQAFPKYPAISGKPQPGCRSIGRSCVHAV